MQPLRRTSFPLSVLLHLSLALLAAAREQALNHLLDPDAHACMYVKKQRTHTGAGLRAAA